MIPWCLHGSENLLQMKLKQELDDTKKLYADNKTTLEHWSVEHDKLQLEDIE